MAASAEEIEELYRQRYRSFRDGIAVVTGEYDTARDVVQEAFAKALRDRRQYRGDGSLAAWIWKIALRIALRSRTSERQAVSLDDLVAAAPLASPEEAATTERVEVRDGREFIVTVLPQAKRRRPRKPARTKKDVRAQAIAERSGLGV
jgi:DNA-directed RNA polymerase specialized sigma24 family protein